MAPNTLSAFLKYIIPTPFRFGTYGYGAMNNEARNFVDFLAECNLSLWQMLPIHPTPSSSHPDYFSPYQCQSVHAGNPLLISLQLLDGQKVELARRPNFVLPAQNRPLIKYRYECLKGAYSTFYNSKILSSEKLQEESQYDRYQDERFYFMKFQHENAWWLRDYALFRVLKEQFEYRPWWDWEPPYRNRDQQVLEQFRQENAAQIEQQCYEQFLFFQQWFQLKEYANNNGIFLIGDMPFFVAEDSVEMWAYRDNFLLNERGRAKFFAGTDPQDDYFKPDEGQCWGLPIYNWEHLEKNGFQWWVQRFNTMSRLFDMVRLTHFRGYVRTWAIPSETSNPKDGVWLPEHPPAHGENGLSAHVEKMFERLKEEWQHPIPLIVDDIGVEKERERDVYDLWHEKFRIIDDKNKLVSKMFGMKVLQLGFTENGLRDVQLPHHYTPTRVAYTGTHDSDTSLGWFNQLDQNRKFVLDYFNMNEQGEVTATLIRAVIQSPAQFAIIPMQDMVVPHR